MLLLNVAVAQQKNVEPPLFSHSPGFFHNRIELSLSSSLPDVTIYYTTDGSQPDRKSKEYKRPIAIDSTTVIRARAYKKNYLPSKTVTSTYFINEKSSFAIVSLSLNPDDLWDEKNGIYVEGTKASPKHPHYGANYWKNWEKRGHIEFWDTNGTLAFSQDIGVKIFGGWSRSFPQKSFKLYAKEEYGESYINYQIFPDKPIKKFKRIVLRNGGSDCDGSHFRDEFMIGMMKNSGVDMQSYRPAIVFLNGQYWGIYFVREKIDEYFIEENYDIDKDSIDMVEKSNIPKCGSLKNYNAFLDYLRNHDLSNPLNYAHVKTMMDVENYIKFSTAQLYFQNRDAAGNTRCWRSLEDGSKWRWILYDVDLGYGRFNKDAYRENSFEFCTNPNGPYWPNPPWSTFLLRKMFESEEFRIAYINQMADYLNSIFYPDSVLGRINMFQNMLDPEIERQQERWGWKKKRWLQHIEIMNGFASKRPGYIRKQMLEFFNLQDTYSLTLNTSDGGKVKVNSYTPTKYSWKGIYFTNVPLEFTAIPNTNYRFAGWKGLKGNTASCIGHFKSDTAITALFIPIPLSYMYDSVTINEVGFHIHKNDDAGDWIELVNSSSKDIDMSGWAFADSKDEHVFYLPDKLILKAGQYIVICSDIEKFEEKFPNVINVIGNFEFGLNRKKETLRLFDKNGDFIDSLTYRISEISMADTSTNSISLTNPAFSNHLMKNWIAYRNMASPGTINQVYAKKIEEEAISHKRAQEIWSSYRLFATIASIILLLIGVLLFMNEKRKRKVVLK